MSDGVTHINVYSKGKTELGRLLSNFAWTPFELDGRKFASVEGWWYWRKTGDEQVCGMYGFEAKQRGQSLPVMNQFAPTRDELKRVYQTKVDQNPRIKAMMRVNTLPYDHYYMYNDIPKDTKHRWTGQLWNEISPG